MRPFVDYRRSDVLFFFLVALAGGLAYLVQAVALSAANVPLAMAWGLAFGLLFAGIDHLRMPERYRAMLPRAVPWPGFVIAFTGLCEIAGAVGLLLPPTRPLAGWMLALYFVCVFPANIRNAVEGLAVDGLPGARWYYWARLPFQPLIIWWALFASGATRWPFG